MDLIWLCIGHFARVKYPALGQYFTSIGFNKTAWNVMTPHEQRYLFEHLIAKGEVTGSVKTSLENTCVQVQAINEIQGNYGEVVDWNSDKGREEKEDRQEGTGPMEVDG